MKRTHGIYCFRQNAHFPVSFRMFITLCPHSLPVGSVPEHSCLCRNQPPVRAFLALHQHIDGNEGLILVHVYQMGVMLQLVVLVIGANHHSKLVKNIRLAPKMPSVLKNAICNLLYLEVSSHFTHACQAFT